VCPLFGGNVQCVAAAVALAFNRHSELRLEVELPEEVAAAEALSRNFGTSFWL
jgi:hypothetical protein